MGFSRQNRGSIFSALLLLLPLLGNSTPLFADAHTVQNLPEHAAAAGKLSEAKNSCNALSSPERQECLMNFVTRSTDGHWTFAENSDRSHPQFDEVVNQIANALVHFTFEGSFMTTLNIKFVIKNSRSERGGDVVADTMATEDGGTITIYNTPTSAKRQSILPHGTMMLRGFKQEVP